MSVIKRYSNRKLYDTDSKRYVTLDDLAQAIRRGEAVRVVDHVSGEDLTSLTMLQIIFEEQKRIGGLLPGVFLTRLIQAGGDRVSAVRSRLAGFDPQRSVDEEIKRRVLVLVEQGTLTTEEALRITDLLTPPLAQADVIHIPVKGEDEAESAAPAASSDQTPDPAQVEELLKQIQTLEQTLQHMKEIRGENTD